jgi:superfamily II DNA or RNA helicase
MAAIADAIKKAAPNGKIMIFLPSVETAQIMSRHMNEVGITCDWVAGISEDRKAKIQAYKAGKIQAICNMALLTEGFDHDAIDTMVILRPTKVRSLYSQMVGRGTRPLNTIIGALSKASNALERHAIIKASAKPVLTILDFLWLYKKHDLCKPASLVSDREDVAEQVEKNIEATDGDLIAAEERAEVDLLAKLEEAVRKNSDRKAEVVDPLALAAELGDLEIANYTPDTKRDAQIPTVEQLRQIAANGVSVANIKHRGHARLILERLVKRHEQGLCPARQLNFLRTLGIDAAHMSFQEANDAINKWTAEQGGRKDVIA